MDAENPLKEVLIRPGMTLLEVMDLYPQSETVFRRYDGQAGVCLCCQALFEPLRQIAEKYNLNLKTLLEDLEFSARVGSETSNLSDGKPVNRSLGDNPSPKS